MTMGPELPDLPVISACKPQKSAIPEWIRSHGKIPSLRTTANLSVVALLPIALAACTQERVQLVKPPANLTTCADEPQAPSLPPVDWTATETARPIQRQRDETTLAYILGLRSAYGSCKAAVAGVKAWSDELE